VGHSWTQRKKYKEEVQFKAAEPKKKEIVIPSPVLHYQRFEVNAFEGERVRLAKEAKQNK
jgi:hypothetical protein